MPYAHAVSVEHGLLSLVLVACLGWSQTVSAAPVEMDARALLVHTTSDDGLWIALELTGDEPLDLARSLGNLTVIIEQGTRRFERRARLIGKHVPLSSLVLFVKPAGLGIGDDTQREGFIAQRALLPWDGDALALEPGTVRVMLSGARIALSGNRVPYQTDWVSFEIQASGRERRPIRLLLEKANDEVEKLLKKQGDVSAKIMQSGFTGETDQGELTFRVVTDKSSGEWSYQSYEVVLRPNGSVQKIVSDTYTACVAEGSLVLTDRGALPIERLTVGTRVLSARANGRDVSWTHIESMTSHVVDEIWVINDRFRLTAEHPVAAWGRWVAAFQLPIGTPLMTLDGVQRVTSKERLQQSTRVFDVTVGEPHAFFADGLLVHNKSIARPSTEYTYDPARPTGSKTDLLLRGESERVRKCVPSHVREVAVRVSARGLIGLSIPGSSEREALESRHCIVEALTPITSSMPDSRDYERIWRYDLREPSKSGRVKPMDASAAKAWVAQQSAQLSSCFHGLGLTVASMRLYLNFGEQSHLGIIDVRDQHGMPVDGRSRDQREAFSTCVQDILRPYAWPLTGEKPFVSIRARLEIRPGKVDWTELSRSETSYDDFP